ncbi:hypothetical protein KTO58_24965 [Chitinophaga pendula]|uniref:hypothetical protein n=1 Tax=Chitinophaga TaxID=79328 RepID=UPI000BAE824C|nr:MULTISPECIES: hypothetical protein [Chitinophaga]ASZ10166.1 hypothetical protein CK934_03805 [Chitinophaga sp. MD30]UCJ06879.1 hypothetical protein KTO58_24965 [Chitinophaga pendula]
MDNFNLKFQYKGQPHILEVHPQGQGYKQVYKVTIAEHEVTFEHDEDSSLRAIVDKGAHEVKLDVGLLEEVARLIEDHLISGQQ